MAVVVAAGVAAAAAAAASGMIHLALAWCRYLGRAGIIKQY
jgi:hypothetical protein